MAKLYLVLVIGFLVSVGAGIDGAPAKRDQIDQNRSSTSDNSQLTEPYSMEESEKYIVAETDCNPRVRVCEE